MCKKQSEKSSENPGENLQKPNAFLHPQKNGALVVLVDELSSSLSWIFSFPVVFAGTSVGIPQTSPPPKGQVTGHRPMVILRPLSMAEDLEDWIPSTWIRG